MEAPIESLTTLQNPSIDFDILELWIDDCSTSHGGIGSENFDYSSIMGMKTLKPERSRPLRDLKRSQICCSFVCPHKVRGKILKTRGTIFETEGTIFKAPGTISKTLSDAIQATANNL